MVRTPLLFFLLLGLTVLDSVHGALYESHYHRHLRGGLGDRQRCGIQEPSSKDKSRAIEVERAWIASSQAFEPVEIDTYVHVITSSQGIGALTMEQISVTMDHVNESYQGTGFSFALKGVSCTANDVWFTAGLDDDFQYKSELRQGDEATLNLYFLNLGQFLGFATFPMTYQDEPLEDGVVMLSNQYTGSDAAPFDEGDTVVHEIGHWLGLFHTFSDFRLPLMRPLYCLFFADNDMVADTPKQYSPTSNCPKSKDSCRLFNPGPDAIHNYMDYSFDECLFEFSPGQITRMQSQWMQYRSSGGNVGSELTVPEELVCSG